MIIFKSKYYFAKNTNISHIMGKHKILSCFLGLTIMSLLNYSCKSSFGQMISLSDQLEEIMNYWPGEYSNTAQINKVWEEGGKVWRVDNSGEGGFLHITSHYIRLDRSDIGKNVLYVEEYRDNIPSETYRQRIYTLSVDQENNQIRVKMWPFKDKVKYVGAWKDSDLLSSISVDDINAYPDICDLIVLQQDHKYYMYMNDDDCTFGTKTFNYEVLLEKNVFNYRDKITDSSNNSVTSAANFAYHKLDRIN